MKTKRPLEAVTEKCFAVERNMALMSEGRKVLIKTEISKKKMQIQF